MNKYSVSPKMPRSGAPAIFMNSVYALPFWSQFVAALLNIYIENACRNVIDNFLTEPMFGCWHLKKGRFQLHLFEIWRLLISIN